MQTRFLLGPAGSGKTSRCLAEIRAALRASAEGLPLVFVAPKQATFQLERQLLADPALPGYTRLHILSFERLAEFVFTRLRRSLPSFLNDEGRVMVLRALLERKQGDLELFRASARLPGFAQQLSQLLRELQRHQLTPARLEIIAAQVGSAQRLDHKLHDLALLLRAYREWLAGHQLKDADSLLDEATALLRQADHDPAALPASSHLQSVERRLEVGIAAAVGPKPVEDRRSEPPETHPPVPFTVSPLRLGGLWLDGFAEMTPQELDLLAALAPHWERATLAFCLDSEPATEPSWLSTWSVVARTFRQCHQRLAGPPGHQVTVEVLPRQPERGRFTGNPVFQHLEQHWAQPSGLTNYDLRFTQPQAGESPIGGAHPSGTGFPPLDHSSNQAPEHPSPALQAPSPLVRRGERDGVRGVTLGSEAQVEDNVRDTLSPLRIIQCSNPEAEATLAAREILRFVREDPVRRFRDCAVLLRTLDGYHAVLRRVFDRYEIPIFLDRRESVAHHPLAELTRSALRTVAFDWSRDDWFGALKTGLAGVDETDIDLLENEALARGWQGKDWQEPLPVPDDERWGARVERLRKKLVPPFQVLAARLAGPVSGSQLAAALRDFWHDLNVEARLEEWSVGHPDLPPWAEADRGIQARPLTPALSPSDGERVPAGRVRGISSGSGQFHTAGVQSGGGHGAVRSDPPSQVHGTVWQQMQAWLGNVERAFAQESISLRAWLPILDAGLANLSVGVIPPVLDQVLIGTIDRSRNPDLKLALLLGMNETVFPAAPAPASLLTDADREVLARHNAALGLTTRQQIGHERYYGYIACTRARERLVLTFSARDAEDRVLNPSPFLTHLQRLFPALPITEAPAGQPWTESEHVCELAAPLLKSQISNSSFQIPDSHPVVASLRRKLGNLRNLESDSALSLALATRLYGPVLKTSVSRLEQFAACPFKFFIHSGLQAEERKLFELDARERGSFQHEVLARFHAEVRARDQQWRDLTPAEARELVGRIAGELAGKFGEGLFQADDRSLFTARSLTAALQNFIATIIGWMAGYGFDPHAVEVAFGTGDHALPAWELDLGHGRKMAFRGKIDRVDLLVNLERDEAWCVVLDYKSRSKKIDPLLLEHGIQIQLPAYLASLCRLSDPRPVFGVSRLVPAGVFYVNLRGDYGRGASRRAVLDAAEEAVRQAYRHLGQFSLRALPELDRSHARTGVKSGQFNYQITKEGRPYKNSTSVVEHEQFVAMLARVEDKLTELGRAIYAGDARVDPYRRGKEKACNQCDYQGVCRIDPWTHGWRFLKKTSPATTEETT